MSHALKRSAQQPEKHHAVYISLKAPLNLKLPIPAHVSTLSTKPETVLGTDCCQFLSPYQGRGKGPDMDTYEHIKHTSHETS